MFGATHHPVDLRCVGNPVLNRPEIQNRCSGEHNVSIGTVVPIGAGFALSGKVETKSFAAWELRTVADVVGGDNHAKGWVLSCRMGWSGLLVCCIPGPSIWFGGGR